MKPTTTLNGSEPITPAMLRKIHTQLSQLNLMEHKPDLVAHFTSERTRSSRQLRQAEAIELSNHLATVDIDRDTVEKSRAQMIKKLYAIGYDMGYDRPRTEAQQMMTPSAICRQNLQAWINSRHCSIHKPINSCSNTDLWTILTQFEQVFAHFKTNYQRNG